MAASRCTLQLVMCLLLFLLFLQIGPVQPTLVAPFRDLPAVFADEYVIVNFYIAHAAFVGFNNRTRRGRRGGFDVCAAFRGQGDTERSSEECFDALKVPASQVCPGNV